MFSYLIIDIKIWFDTFLELFGVDPFGCASLPSMAQKSMMLQYNKDSPALFSLPFWMKDFLEEERENIVGGFVDTRHKYITLDPERKITAPDAAVKAPNGDDYNAFVGLDFNRYIILNV